MAGNEKPKLIIGTKGVQYGLQKVAPKKPGLSLAAAAPAARKPANVFGDDDSEEEDVEKQIARQAEKKRAAAKVRCRPVRTRARASGNGGSSTSGVGEGQGHCTKVVNGHI